MSIDWFRWGIDPWILEHPLVGAIIIGGCIIWIIWTGGILWTQKS